MSETPSFGIELESREALERLSGEEIRQLVFKHGWLLVRGAHYEAQDFDAMAARLGNHLEYGFGKVLDLEAQKESAESQFTNASMPLHQDAILNADNSAQFLVFRCLEASPGEGGETLLSNNRAFMKNAPKELMETLKEVEFAYTPITKGYYTVKDGQEDIKLPPLTTHPVTGEAMPHLALDDPEDERRNYAASVAGYDAEKSRAVMEAVDEALRAPDVLAAHEWNVGDFLILDNYLTCHGRNTSTKGTKRRIQRIVIKVQDQAAAA